MKLHTFFLTSHAMAAGFSAILSAVTFQSSSLLIRFAGLLGCAVVTIATAIYCQVRIRRGLAAIETAATDHEQSGNRRCGLHEFDLITDRVARYSEEWEGVAASSRQQTREFQMMLQMLNRRGSGRKATSSDLRHMLGSLGMVIHGQWQKIHDGADTVEAKTREISDHAENQRHAVIKTTGYVEQLSAAIETINHKNQRVLKSLTKSNQTSGKATESLSAVSDSIERLRTHSQSCEKKLRGLNDPSQQITAILGTVTEITSRTQMLALNASIESIRAGEYGKEFAMVADEVRELAEQANDATREIGSLVESMQLVTRESIDAVSKQREDLQVQAQSVREVAETIADFDDNARSATGTLKDIEKASTKQFQLASDIVEAVEEISQLAKRHRENAENVCWTMRNLCDASPDVNDAIDRLRNCSDDSGRTLEPAYSTGSSNTPGLPAAVQAPSTNGALSPMQVG